MKERRRNPDIDQIQSRFITFGTIVAILGPTAMVIALILHFR